MIVWEDIDILSLHLGKTLPITIIKKYMPFVWIYIDIDIYISLSVNKTDVYVCYCT